MDKNRKAPKRPVKIGTGFAFSLLERTLHEGLARRDFGTSHLEQVIAFFGGHPVTCVYCGESPQRWDHLVPVRRGGETVIGNMVPACARCDDSKQALSVEEWWTSTRRHSPASREADGQAERLAKLRAYAAHFGYEPRRLEERLTNEEEAQLQKIRRTAGSLREEIESLVRMYGQRTRTEGSTS
jgi:hypothetical protein